MQGRKIDVLDDGFRLAEYRPFTQQYCYFDPQQQLNNCTYRLPSIFPTAHHSSIGIGVSAPSNRTPFSVLALKRLFRIRSA